jgi:hypothetical protein
MSAMPIVRLDAGKELKVAVAELLAVGDYPEIARWIQFPRALMLFLFVPGDPRSGAVYIYDRCDGIWYWVDFQDQNYGGYSLAELEVLLGRCYFLRLVENPRCLRTSEWFVTPGQAPQAVAVCVETVVVPELLRSTTKPSTFRLKASLPVTASIHTS